MTTVHREDWLEDTGQPRLFAQAWIPEVPKARLTIVHGLGDHSGRYTGLAGDLAAAGIAVCAADYRGHGRSEGQRGFVTSWEDLRRDVRRSLAWCAHQVPDVPHFLMGHSLGGLIVSEFLTQPDIETYNLRAAIVSAPALINNAVPEYLMVLSRILSRIWPTLSMNTQLDANGIAKDPAEVQRYINDPLIHVKGTPRLGAEADAAMQRVWANPAAFRTPLLIIHGEHDALIPVESSRRLYATLAPGLDKQLIVYPGGYHESHTDTPRQQLPIDIAAWIDAHL